MVRKAIEDFLKLESSSSILLMVATALAMTAANSAAAGLYDGLLQVLIEVRVGSLGLSKPILLWINDGLMAVFFLLIGLEVKREILQGELSSPSQVILPGIGAAGGMLVPALIYVALNRGDSIALNGWAIPAATDIAFALGVLALLGKRIPVSLKFFLLALAIIDDLGAIIVIAVFYSGALSTLSLLLAAACLGMLAALNVLGVKRIAPYIIVGVFMWVFVLKSGVHATLAGVALAFAVPLRGADEHAHSPLLYLEHSLHPWVAFAILPTFAFANAGVSLKGLSAWSLFQRVPMGILLGLLAGKQIGVFGFSWVAIKLGLARAPERATTLQLYGVSVLCGIGFTMSLFIGSLAFEHTGGDYLMTYRVGILAGSLISAVWGYATLRVSLEKKPSEESASLRSA